MDRDVLPTDSRPQIQSEWGDEENPCVGIVEAVATTTGRESTDLPPLYESVDLDAVTALLTNRSGDGEGTVDVTFTHAGVRVAVDSDGRIEATPGPSDEG